MAAKVPATFKAVVPFIRRAEELDKDQSRPESRLIAYYCRQYAMELGIKLRENDTSDEATEFLLNLMDTLEGEKKKLPPFTQDEGKQICEEFAFEIFGKADDEDRAGNADKNTARTFYAAGTFLDILSQFGEVSDDILEKRKYCKYKAASILKAIKEGRRPTPGPPDSGENEQESGDAGQVDTPSMTPSAPLSPTGMAPPMMQMPPMAPSSPPMYNNGPSFQDAPMDDSSDSIVTTPSTAFSTAPPAAPSNSFSAAPPAPPAASSNSFAAAPQNAYTPMNVAPPAAPNQFVAQAPPNSFATSNPPPVARPAYGGGMGAGSGTGGAYRGNLNQDQISDAMECAKFAVAALKVKDINLARQRLETALQSLR